VECLEALERGIARQAPIIVERSICESPDDLTAIRRVRRITLIAAQAGPEFVEVITGSEAWAQFKILYPREADHILSQAKLGLEPEDRP